MIKALYSYLGRQLAPRWRRVLVSGDTVVGTVAGVAGALGAYTSSDGVELSDVSGLVLTYGTLGLGIALAGLTIVLAFPTEYARVLATNPPEDPGRAHADLLFIFSWTALCHWLLLGVFVLVIAGVGPKALVLKTPIGIACRVGSGVCGGLFAYCFCQFLVVLITLTQVGSVYGRFLRQGSTGSGQRDAIPSPTGRSGETAVSDQRESGRR